MDEGVEFLTHSALSALQKEKTDIYNRLRSIREDTQFVSRISKHYPHLPILRESSSSLTS